MTPAVLESVELTHKDSLGDQLWSRVTARIRKDHEFQARFGKLDEKEQIEWSERILNETLGFLKLCSLGVGGFAPSPLVDIGWHTFMLYSRGYMAFCDEVNGAYIHHEPTDDPTVTYDEVGSSTPDAMSQHRITVDFELWEGPFAIRCEGRPDCTADGQPAVSKCHSHCRNGGGHG